MMKSVKVACLLLFSFVLFVENNAETNAEIKSLFLNLSDLDGESFDLNLVSSTKNNLLVFVLTSTFDCSPCVADYLSGKSGEKKIDYIIIGYVGKSEARQIIELVGSTSPKNDSAKIRVLLDKNNEIIRHLKIRNTPVLMVVDKKFNLVNLVPISL